MGPGGDRPSDSSKPGDRTAGGTQQEARWPSEGDRPQQRPVSPPPPPPGPQKSNLASASPSGSGTTPASRSFRESELRCHLQRSALDEAEASWPSRWGRGGSAPSLVAGRGTPRQVTAATGGGGGARWASSSASSVIRLGPCAVGAFSGFCGANPRPVPDPTPGRRRGEPARGRGQSCDEPAHLPDTRQRSCATPAC